MAHFRGTVKGRGKTTASRLGTKDSGLVVEANGWFGGVTVEVMHVNGKDVFYVYETGGSADFSGKKELVHHFTVNA